MFALSIRAIQEYFLEFLVQGLQLEQTSQKIYDRDIRH